MSILLDFVIRLVIRPWVVPTFVSSGSACPGIPVWGWGSPLSWSFEVKLLWAYCLPWPVWLVHDPALPAIQFSAFQWLIFHPAQSIHVFNYEIAQALQLQCLHDLNVARILNVHDHPRRVHDHPRRVHDHPTCPRWCKVAENGISNSDHLNFELRLTVGRVFLWFLPMSKRRRHLPTLSYFTRPASVNKVHVSKYTSYTPTGSDSTHLETHSSYLETPRSPHEWQHCINASISVETSRDSIEPDYFLDDLQPLQVSATIAFYLTFRLDIYYQANPAGMWHHLQDDYLRELIRLEGRGDAVQNCQACHCRNGLLRCQDCLVPSLYCEDCVKRLHLDNPCHRIQVCHVLSCFS